MGADAGGGGARVTAREQFDRQAEHYNAQWNSWSERSLAWMLERAGCRPSGDVLDVATGGGFTALAFAPRVRSVTALDVSPRMLDQARRRAAEQGLTNLTFREGDAGALPFPDATFDIVTCRIAAHHFPEVALFAREAARVLRPRGRLVLVDTCVPDGEPEADAWQNGVEALRDPSHVRNHTPAEWRRCVEEAGLRLEALETDGDVPIPLEDWLIKAGCSGERAEEVRRLFREAPEPARRAFAIESAAGGGITFVWQRVLLLAAKASAADP